VPTAVAQHLSGRGDLVVVRVLRMTPHEDAAVVGRGAPHVSRETTPDKCHGARVAEPENVGLHIALDEPAERRHRTNHSPARERGSQSQFSAK